MKQKLQRTHAMTFRVTEEEREMIRRRQEQTGMENTRAYLLKMAIDRRVISVELDSVREMNRLLSNISGNINQIARKLNAGGRIYDGELEKIQAQQEEIWQQQKEILRKVGMIIDPPKIARKSSRPPREKSQEQTAEPT